MGIISWIIFGLIAGWVASLIVGDHRRSGCLTNMFTGIVGALLGGFIYRIATGQPWSFQFDFASFGVAVLGSIVLVLIISLLTHRRN